MKIRRFYSNNVRSALKQVTETFGSEAAILSNKKVAGGVEVIAALDYDDSLIPQYAASHKKLDSSHSLSTDQQISLPNKKSSLRHSLNSNIDFEQVEWPLDPNLQSVKEELEMMRSMMSEQFNGMAWQNFSTQNPLKAMVARRLTQLGLNSDAINRILPRVTDEKDAECAWQKVLVMLNKSIPVANNDLLRQGGVYALLGPTGVGKTTTLAKLAARFVIKHGVGSVALISTDNCRITAQEQIQTFGQLLNVPTATASNSSDLNLLLKKFSDKKLILIDTAGVGSSDQTLTKSLEMFNHCNTKIHKLLLMPATSQSSVLENSIALFSASLIHGFIVTKLDEATSLGNILSIVTKQNIPVMYSTDGQKIPEDIRIAKSHHLISKAVWLASKYEIKSEEWALSQGIKKMKIA